MNKPVISKQVIILVVLIVVLAAQNLYLSKQNTELMGVNFKLLREQNAKSTLARGDTVQNFYAYDVDSTEVFINLESRKKTLLMVFSTHCHACKENKKYWDAIVDQYDSASVNVVFLALDSPNDLKTYSPVSSSVGMTVSVIQDTTLIRNYKLYQTPQTILVGSDRKVIKSLAGVLTSNDVSQIVMQSRMIQ